MDTKTASFRLLDTGGVEDSFNLLSIEYEPSEGIYLLHKDLLKHKQLKGGLFDLLDEYLIKDIVDKVYKLERDELLGHMAHYKDVMNELKDNVEDYTYTEECLPDRHYLNLETNMLFDYKLCLHDLWVYNANMGHITYRCIKYGRQNIHYTYCMFKDTIPIKILSINSSGYGYDYKSLREAILTKKYINIEQEALDAYNSMNDERKKQIEQEAIKATQKIAKRPCPYLPDGQRFFGISEVVGTYEDRDYGLKTIIRYDYIHDRVGSVVTTHTHILDL